MIDYSGYAGCLALENGETRVVLGHHAGGRVLEYALQGENALYLDQTHAGWTYTPGEQPIHITAGRCDIGPEHVIPRHPTLWMGEWTAETIGPRHAQLTSQDDRPTGVRLTRDFALSPSGTHLAFTQTQRNVSDQVTEWCHWSRTFALHGGIGVVPLTKHPMSRFPRGYVMYGPGQGIVFRPEDPNIVRESLDGEDYLIIRGVPQNPKLGFDSYAAWFAYLEPTGVAFVKRFPCFPDRVYNEVAAITSCIYYPREKFVELEPIGPRETLRPGESASYTEDWFLVPFGFPSTPEALDLGALVKAVRAALDAA